MPINQIAVIGDFPDYRDVGFDSCQGRYASPIVECHVLEKLSSEQVTVQVLGVSGRPNLLLTSSKKGYFSQVRRDTQLFIFLPGPEYEGPKITATSMS